VVAVVAVAALGAGLGGPPQAAANQPENSAKKAKPQAEQHVTLLTGDRVTVTGGETGHASVEPAPGRRGIRFSTFRVKDQLYVVPSDVQKQFVGGQLDRRLFDVAGLIKDGYDDKSSKAIPVIVTYGGPAQKRAAAPGATLTRQLPAVNGAALKVDKAKGASFLAGLTARSASGVEKVWLDGKRKLTLDESVPQIGAPAAWQAGYTGKGVSVAVLDSGIDTSHPDLATQVGGAKNFTDTPDGDRNGHGTHVASTIAGTAAASAGKYKGVAPDAKLYDGKVCDDSGSCPESAILAGMDWAANEVKANVVNLSLAGWDTPDLDPLEEAVNRLTASTGTLFVVAAGNQGPAVGTVGSPGSAEAALTVGAVDKQDQLADFSGRGPRLGDGAIKPDVTAPGVGIVAAKAKTTVIGQPVGDQYLRLSGTSMATPHTAGAAALLAQHHPDWKASELKGALMASAKPAAGQSVFGQGAGRIDVALGIKQTVISEPGSLSYGTAQFPHDDDEPVTKTLTYRNLGSQAVTLDLTATLTGPDGKPAPTEAFSLSASTVSVPPGGTAAVQATSNTKHNGPNGQYSGRVIATAGEISAAAVVAVHKEDEHYELTLQAIGPDGQPGTVEMGAIYAVATGEVESFFEAHGEVKYRLPKGEYLVHTSQFVPDPVDPEATGRSFHLVQPSLQLTKDTTAVFDARTAKKVTVTVPRADAETVSADIMFQRRQAPADEGYIVMKSYFTFDPVYTGQVGPAVAPELMTNVITSQWAKPGADGQLVNSPYVYGQLDTPVPGGFPTGFRREVKAAELAVVEQQVNAASGRQVQLASYGKAAGTRWAWGKRLVYDQPASVRLMVDDTPAIWSADLHEIAPSSDPEWPHPDEITQLTAPYREYRAGRTYRQRFNAAVFTPAPSTAWRQGDVIGVGLDSLMDADGNRGSTAMDTESTKLIRDGQVIAESPSFGFLEAVGLPAEKTKYTLRAAMTRQSYAAFSTRTDLSWTFSSAGAAEEVKLPMVGVRYQPTVNSHNVAERKPVTVLPFTLEPQVAETLPGIKKVTVQVSGDDGLTWHQATVKPSGSGSYQAIFATPKGAKTVSLKAHVVDAEGNVTDQTTIGAYPLG